MPSKYKSLIEARNQWLTDKKLYKDFLKGGTKTVDNRLGAEDYILMTKNRLRDINL